MNKISLETIFEVSEKSSLQTIHDFYFLNKLQQQWVIEDFEILNQIGKGKYGITYLSFEKKQKEYVAIKKIQKKYINENHLQKQLRREIEIHYRLCHKHIIRLYGYFQDQDFIYLVMEYAKNNSLFLYLQEKRTLAEQEAARILYQISSAVDYLNKRNVIHRDIKAENILLNENMDVKLTDFGWSVISINENNNMRSSFCGTLECTFDIYANLFYQGMAPEILENKQYNKKVDIWALGVLLYEMLIGQNPFYLPKNLQLENDLNKTKIIQQVDQQKIQHLSKEAQSLILKLLEKDEQKRTNIQNIKADQFIILNFKYK